MITVRQRAVAVVAPCAPAGGQPSRANEVATGAALAHQGAVRAAIALLFSLPRRGLFGLVRLYQVFISPALPPACRYYPSCSQYAAESLLTHGALRGSWLALRRLLRCHPWALGGPDPVPPRAPAAGTPFCAPRRGR